MKNLINIYFWLIIIIFLKNVQAFACMNYIPIDNLIETFHEKDKPQLITKDYREWHTPWGYNKPENSNRKYPIVVFGRWGEESYFEEYKLPSGLSPKQRYPYFSLRKFHESTDVEGRRLADLIERMSSVHGYRIDMNRIYYEGFSWGGSGSYPLIRGMKDRGKFFAGVIRIAGQSQTKLPDEVILKTSIWYHIGLRDEPVRVTVARTAYDYIKKLFQNSNALESIDTDTILFTGDKYQRKTMTLTKNGVEIMKLSEYEGMGHIPGPPLSSPDVFHWLFSQSLCNE